MRVRVEVLCAPHPREDVKSGLRLAGKQLTRTADSVSVRIDPADPRRAILAFEMRQAAQHNVVDDVLKTVKMWAWAFYEDVTIEFTEE